MSEAWGMNWEDARAQVEDAFGDRKDFGVEFCNCGVGAHEWLEHALGQTQMAVLESLDDPGDLRDSYDYERYTSLRAAANSHFAYGHKLILARTGEELLGAASFLIDFTSTWQFKEELRRMEHLLEVSELGTTGAVKGVGKELMMWLGAVAALRGQEVSVLAGEGSERFYEKLGMSTLDPEMEASRYLWRKKDLPALGHDVSLPD